MVAVRRDLEIFEVIKIFNLGFLNRESMSEWNGPRDTTERKNIPGRLSGLSLEIDEGYLNLDLLYELNGERKPFPRTR
jgi:hypothetical protein